MKCERIRSLLLTDYLDDEVTQEVKEIIDAHLAGCCGCAGFLAQLRQKAQLPFKEAGRVKPPEHVWASIRESLRECSGRKELSRRRGAFDLLRGLLQAHRPAFALSAVAAMAVIVVLAARIPVHNRRLDAVYLAEQAAFFVNGNGGSSGFDMDMGTGVEYFLL
ncbi:MAG: zf-HC2 domain-containing protein [Candidatus Omnitrophica bacterium]|nr:zf-HC2 domain-containing protein [Candidatus Omnitrophota bacterium]